MVMDPGRAGAGDDPAANALCFGLLHAVPLGWSWEVGAFSMRSRLRRGSPVGLRDVPLTLPVAALVSHWGADAASSRGCGFSSPVGPRDP